MSWQSLLLGQQAPHLRKDSTEGGSRSNEVGGSGKQLMADGHLTLRDALRQAEYCTSRRPLCRAVAIAACEAGEDVCEPGAGIDIIELQVLMRV